MKALFLDIDGVCNSEESLKRQYLRKGKATILEIDPEMAFRVGKIILNTDCKLIISSSWRHWPEGMEQIKDAVYHDIYGITPTSGKGFRGNEIKAYLDEHQFEVYSYMADSTGYYIGTRKEQNHTVIAGSTKEALDKVFALRADEKRDHNYAIYAKVKSSKELV